MAADNLKHGVENGGDLKFTHRTRRILTYKISQVSFQRPIIKIGWKIA